MRILITGSRNFDNFKLMKYILNFFKEEKEVTLIHGNCRGADKIAGYIGKSLGFNIEAHPADWNRYGKKAGPIRNTEMVDSGADLVLAFPIGNSYGTKDCIRKAEQRGIPIVEVTNTNMEDLYKILKNIER